MVAILSPNVLPSIRLTADEYLQADLPEGQRYELVDGVVEMSPTPDGAHSQSLDALLEAIYLYRIQHQQAIRHVAVRASIVVPPGSTVREPDLAVYREWSGPMRGWIAWTTAAPCLVAEIISPGQEKRDYEDKRRDYWLAAIQEYWIVNGQKRCVTVLVRGENDWTETVFGDAQEAVSHALPGLVVSVARLVGSPEPR